MAEAMKLGMDGFSLGTPALVCRWRLAGGTLPLENRHMRALSRRFINGGAISPELVAWAKQHVEWTLAEGSIDHPDGVLMLIIDENGAAAMTVGPYEPLAQRFTRALVMRARSALQEQCETDVAPETIFAHIDGDLVVASAPDAVSGGCASLVLQLSTTLGIPTSFNPGLLNALEDGAVEASGLFLASDEHGIVPAIDRTDDVTRRFEAAYLRLLETARRKRR